MKIKCVRHQRRVVVCENGQMIHRTGDGSKCKGMTLTGTDRIIDETNGQRYSPIDRVLATVVLDDECRWCGMSIEEFNWTRSYILSPLYCPARAMNQPHVWS